MAREPISGSEWRKRRRRGRLLLGGLGVTATLAAAAGAALASGFTLNPEPEAVAKSGLSARTEDLERAHRERVQRALEADVVLGVKRNVLESIAECESGGRPDARSSDGTYRGKYQFDKGTWAAMGGKGDPAKAPELEQDYRAAELYKAAGSSPWPICGQ